jgi:O-antigen/teichoic acid export membrane protein
MPYSDRHLLDLSNAWTTAATRTMGSLRERTLQSLGWSGATRLLGQLLQLAAAVALARLLSPREYGLLGMVLVFTGFATSLADMGLGASIIQRQALSERHLNSVFWLNLATGLALTGLFVLLAPWVARFYHEPQLRWLTMGVAVQFTLAALNVVQNALLEKALEFRVKFWIETVAVVVAGLTGLTMALAGAGVWSLVGQTIAAILVRVLIMWTRSKWRPSFAFDASAVRELLRFGGHLTGFSAVIYWSANVDKLVIGRSIGSAALGIYSLADRLMRLPLTNITDVTTQVMFPVLSTIEGQVPAMQRAYLRSIGMIALLAFPLMLMLSALATPAIVVVYGPRWIASIPILQLLCFAGMAQSIYNTAAWIFLSQGRSDTLFYLGVYTMLVRTAGVLIGAHWGLIGVSWAYVIGTYCLVWYPTWRSASRLLHLSVPTLLREIAGPFACAAPMGLMLAATDRWVFAGWSAAPRLMIQAMLGALLYTALVRTVKLRAWVELRAIVLETQMARSRVIRWLFRADAPAAT